MSNANGSDNQLLNHDNKLIDGTKQKEEDDNNFNESINKTSSSCLLNSLTDDAEEHFEFSPTDFTDDSSPAGSEEDHQANDALNESKLSSDSFRSTSSASSSLGVKYNSNSASNVNPFGRNNHLRQSFNHNHHSRNHSWSRSDLDHSVTSASSLSPSSSRRLQSNNNSVISANGHAKQIFRMKGPNSPGSRRSSLSFDSDEMTSEGTGALSLEEEFVADLTQKVASLEQQVSALNENQSNNDDRYNRVKQENASLLSKVHLLEEQLRDIEVSNEDRRKDEERRLRETMCRLEREKSFESETHLGRIYSLQQELHEAKEEVRKTQLLMEKIKGERNELQDLLAMRMEEMESLKEELAKVKDSIRKHRDDDISSERIIQVLNQELSELKTNYAAIISSRGSFDASNSSTSSSSQMNAKVIEMSEALNRLRSENETLKETNEELQAQLLTSRIEEGKCLIREGQRVTNSLADELITLNEEQVRHLSKHALFNHSVTQQEDRLLLYLFPHFVPLTFCCFD